MNERANAPIHPLNAIADQFRPTESESGEYLDIPEHNDSAESNNGGQAAVTSIPLLKFSSSGNLREVALQLLEPAKRAVCVLSAALDDAETLRTEMLDEEFSELALRVWQISSETLDENGGFIGQFGTMMFLGYFLAEDECAQAPANVIQCALELKQRMSHLGREWKIRKGWLHNIALNMGIDFGTEFMASVASAAGNHLLALGKTVEVASQLSKIGADGQIWASKKFVQRLPEKDLEQLRFGIFRAESQRKIFIPRCFSQIKDLPVFEGTVQPSTTAFASQAVTQIFDRQVGD